MNRKHTAIPARRRLPLLAAAGCLAVAFAAGAQPQAAFHPAYPPVSTAGSMSFEELERHAVQYVPYIKKMEMRDLLMKVDGYDQQGMKVKVHLDRRTGDLLAREVKYDKHGPFGKHGYPHVQGWVHPRPGYPQPGHPPPALPLPPATRP